VNAAYGITGLPHPAQFCSNHGQARLARETAARVATSVAPVHDACAHGAFGVQSPEREQAWADAMRQERLGDQAAYEAFLRELSAYLRRTVRYQLQTFGLGPAETEDVVQEALIAIHARRGEWDARRPLLPWLNAISRYKMIDAARRLRKEARRRVNLDDEQWAAMPAHDETAGARHRDVERLLAQLPPSQQSVARAIGVEGATPAEAAARLGMKEGAVRVAFHRALKRLMAAAKR